MQVHVNYPLPGSVVCGKGADVDEPGVAGLPKVSAQGRPPPRRYDRRLMICSTWGPEILVADVERQRPWFQWISVQIISIGLQVALGIYSYKDNLRPSFQGPRQAPLVAQTRVLEQLEIQRIWRHPPVPIPQCCTLFDAQFAESGALGTERSVVGSHRRS